MSNSSIRRFRVTAYKALDAPRQVPSLIEKDLQSVGPASALATFRRELEERFGPKARRYFQSPIMRETPVSE